MQSCLSTNSAMLSSNIEYISSHISVYLQYYLVCVYISYIFSFSSAILIALNDNLELTVFM